MSARDVARRGFRAFLLSAVLMVVYGVEYGLGWIPATAYLATIVLLLGIAGVAVLASVPWMVLAVADAMRRRS